MLIEIGTHKEKSCVLFQKLDESNETEALVKSSTGFF